MPFRKLLERYLFHIRGQLQKKKEGKRRSAHSREKRTLGKKKNKRESRERKGHSQWKKDETETWMVAVSPSRRIISPTSWVWPTRTNSNIAAPLIRSAMTTNENDISKTYYQQFIDSWYALCTNQGQTQLAHSQCWFLRPPLPSPPENIVMFWFEFKDH